MTYAFVRAEGADYPITVLCRTLGVSVSGYYEALDRPRSKQASENAELLVEMTAIHRDNKARYGSRRHVAEINKRREGQDDKKPVGRNRVRAIMRKACLWAKRRRAFVVTTKSDHQLPVAANVLDRKFQPEALNQAWVGDITYLPTCEGWLYLATVLDLYSRRVVGWALSTSLTRHVALDALQMALDRRHVLPGMLLFHSDRGGQYASIDYCDLLADHTITPSMSRRGNCWDNAVAESFFATLETELLVDLTGQNREAVGQAVFEYIEVYYNRKRLHSTLGYETPCDFEAQAIQQPARQAELARAA